MIYSDNEITRTVIKFDTEHGIPEDGTYDDLLRHFNDLWQHVRATFPGISEKQFLRCIDAALSEPEPTAPEDAEHAARSRAFADALRNSGAANLLELFSGGHDESVRALSDKLAAIPKAPKGH